ncbi:helix-turn-helix domain-containing protein [Streptomyces cyanogenus]|uniref:Anaerobic benzoate catabolism transcriptional regulator n=1 Tax=Streptomyces cyanogenus TaxID=80860 RepID=A0ABX7TIP3_STRCY|nr:pyridoxamine 5'-phosphate oxidase family protein [Streptomyces cyanogenus]QTD96425.1 anaerobic benzoate catabolism transcriptional regulator [Streptomyces cyanogenus]
MTEPTSAPAPAEAPLGDLGRRLAAQRARLGLTRRQTAARADMAVGYLRYLEEQPGAAPRPAVLHRLAQVLETTVNELTGGAADGPPGPGRAARDPHFTELTALECQVLLGSHGVGRLAVATSAGPEIVPVNYSLVDGAIVFRTAPGATPALADGHPVAFEVDRIDDTFSRGWSVVVRGIARAVTDPEQRRRYAGKAHSEPWAGGDRELWLRIEPGMVTGRRITV